MGLLTNFKQNDVFRDEKSLAFDGSNDFVDCGSDSSLDVGTNDFSVSVWFKVSTKGGSNYHDIVAKGNTLEGGVGKNGWGIALVESNKTIFFDTNGDVARQNASTASDAWEFDKWYHLVGTRLNSANTLKLYLNGVLVSTNTGVTNDDLGDASINLKIGSSESSRETKGNISEVAYYNSALTINQVKTIYNGREPYNHKEGVASGNLQAWYRMGDGTGDDFEYINNEATGYSLGNNLVQGNDANFEGVSNWRGHGGATYSDNYDSGDAGHSSTLRIMAESVSFDRAELTQSSLSSTLTAGKMYLVTFDFKNINTTDRTTDNYITIGNTVKQNISRTASGWTYYKSYFVASDNSTNLRIYCNSDSGHADNEILIDSFSIQEVGTNAGSMINMEAIDFEGDTP